MTASSDGWILFLDQRLVCGASSSACVANNRDELRLLHASVDRSRKAQDSAMQCPRFCNAMM